MNVVDTLDRDTCLFSAGVGRSGTFIALDALLQMVHCQDTLDVLQFTYRMRFNVLLVIHPSPPSLSLFLRQNRVYMIQTVDQYVFLYRALIEGIVTMKTHISLSEWINTGKVHLDIQNHYQVRHTGHSLHLPCARQTDSRTTPVDHFLFVSRCHGLDQSE